MRMWLKRIGWMTAGIGGLYVVSALASVATGGSLDPPPGAPAPTMKTLEEIPGTWSRKLISTGGNACDTQRFTCVLSNQAVRDNETGLVWESAPDTGYMAWNDAVRACGDRTTGGRAGWRLPTDAEMRSLLDPGASGQPLVPDGHPFSFAGNFGPVWTMSPVPGETDHMYAVDIDTMDRLADVKTLPQRAWCVRGVQADAPEDSALAEIPPAWYQKLDATGGCVSERFRCVMDYAAVLDRETGLVWQRTPDANLKGSWIAASFECVEAEIGGRRGWRLPTKEEISTLFLDASPSPGLPAGHPFEHSISGFSNNKFWTSSEWDTGKHYAFAFIQGSFELPTFQTDPYRGWCVRAPGILLEDF